MSTTTHFRYHVEVINGREIEKPLPKELHAKLMERIMRLMIASGMLEGFNILPELNVAIGNGDYLIPDITLAREDAEYLDGDLLAQDTLLCIEILSPGQVIWDLFAKAERLRQAGAKCIWVIWGEKHRLYKYEREEPQSVVRLLLPGTGFILNATDLFKDMPIA